MKQMGIWGWMWKSLGTAALTATLTSVAAIDVPTGTWQSGVPLLEARSGAAAVRLTDGDILITGGTGDAVLSSGERVHGDGISEAIASMQNARSGHAASLLSDGRVLITGGGDANGDASDSAEIYDPVFDYWTGISSMHVGRSGHASIALADGRVVIVGGGVGYGAALEVFDPADEQFDIPFLSGLAIPRTGQATVQLLDGRVMILGGSDGVAPLSATQIFDPATGLVSDGPSMSTARQDFSATVLLDGRVLVTGGQGPAGELDTAEIFVPESGVFSALASRLSAPRSGHLGILLPNNNSVLIVSGTSAGQPMAEADLFQPKLGTFVPTGAMTVARSGGAASPMVQDGRLLVAGGSDGNGASSATDVYGFQTVKTDKKDYAPGELVTITGTGWEPGEHVSLLLSRTPKVVADTELAADVDGDGNFQNADFLTQPHDLGVMFELDANGQASGLLATNRFTDGTLAIEGQFGTSGETAGLTAARYTSPQCGGAAGATLNYTMNASGTTPVLNPNNVDSSSSFRLVAAASGSVGGTFSGWSCAKGDAQPFVGGAGPRDICLTGQANDNGNPTHKCTASYTAATVFNTTTTITSDLPDPSVVGQAVTVNVSVTRAGASGGTPTGSVVVTAAGGAETCAATLSGSTATATGSCQITLNSAGSRPLTAAYGGATGFNPSTSAAAAHTVNRANTTTTITSDVPDPSVVGEPYTVSVSVAAVAPGGGLPTGSVVVNANDGTTCTATLAAGSGSCQITPTTAGSKTLTATYATTTNYNGSTSVSVGHLVNKGTTTTSITSDAPDPSVPNQSYTVNWTVAIATGAGTLSGIVTVDDGEGHTCSAAVTSTGCTLTSSTAGGKTLTATYSGDTNFDGSTGIATHLVDKGLSTTTLVSSQNPSAFGQSVTFTATVCAAGQSTGTPTGFVDFKVDGTIASTGLLLPGVPCPTTTFTTTALTAGAHPVVASFNGDDNFQASDSAPLSQQVNKASTTTTITSVVPAPSVVAQQTTVTFAVAIIAPGSGTPSGTVSITDGTDSCTATLPATSCTITFSQKGAKSLIATYSGDTSFQSSVSGAFAHQVNARTTTTTLVLSPTSVFVGQGSVATVTVTDTQAQGDKSVPVGTVVVTSDAGDAITSCTLVANGLASAQCTATITPSQVLDGDRAISASFTATNLVHANSSDGPVALTVQPRTTTTVVELAPTSVLVGQTSTATITVTDTAGAAASTPLGTVAVSTGIASDVLSACTLQQTSVGVAQCTVTVKPTVVQGGSRTVSAAYTANDDVHAGSNGGAVLGVTPRDTTTTVSLSPTSVLVGQASTATITVTDAGNGGDASTPTGTVSVSTGVGSDGLTACALAEESVGIAKCTVSVTPAVVAGGSRTVSASYAANDDIHSNSAGNAALTVTARATSTAITLSPGSVVVGQASTATVTVTDVAASGTKSVPAGSVDVQSSNAGDTIISNCSSISGSVDQATCTVTIKPNTFGGGSRTLSATYTPNDDVHAASTSAPKSLTVSQRSVNVFVALNPATVVTGQTTSVTVRVVDSTPVGDASVPGGTVAMSSSTATDTIGACNLAAFNASEARCTLTVKPNQVNGGSHVISAQFTANDDIHLNGSGGSVLAVNPASTTTVLTSSKDPSFFGDSVTFTAQVCAASPGSGTPTGTVTFQVGANPAVTVSLAGSVCSSATYSISTLFVGTHAVTATYNGSLDYLGSVSATLHQDVNPLVVTSTLTVTPTPRQYSDKVTFVATLDPASVNGLSPATTATFYVGTQEMGTVAVLSGTATLSNVALLENPANPSNWQMEPGSRTAKVVFGGVNSNFTVPDATKAFTITQEDARTTYTGAMFVGTSTSTSLTGTATLSATIQDITAVLGDSAYDPDAGDIRNATVKFVNRDTNATLCTAPIGLVTASDTKTGSAACTATLNVGSCPSAPCSQSYTVGIVVGGYYVNGTDNTVVTISQPGTNFITGGGYLISQASSGMYPAQAGTRNNFGFNVKYNKSKTNLQGNINTIFRNAGRVYQIKGNSMTSLAVQTNSVGGYATFNGKANLTDITNPNAVISIEGGALLQVTMSDLGEPGKNDSIGITLNSSKGGLLFSSNWSGAKTNEQVLNGGNLVVH